ncbi:hypothetical protein BSZ20_37840 [Bradyrhizobium canariense]|nr:hypothetical protein BSZ20_37840 [Bradyrhizobium canariense]OSI42382.1 hypothetical protein BST67_37190 [Bradyrhizobium canariense]OSI82896.1 hypothetical protein BSZ24_38225 [Bradyrhizobium canariense]
MQFGKIDLSQHVASDCLQASRLKRGRDVMTNAGNALLWTAIFFCLSFASIFVVWFAERLRAGFVRKP